MSLGAEKVGKLGAHNQKPTDPGLPSRAPVSPVYLYPTWLRE